MLLYGDSVHTDAAISLNEGNLSLLADHARVPTFERQALRPSIVHIGVGGFHRSHLATYVHELAEQGNSDWAIVGVGVLPSDVRIAGVLERQDHLYTLISRGADRSDLSVIGSIVDFVHAADDAEPFLDLVAAPTTQIVSMTVTEGGYPVDDVSGEFVADGIEGTAFDLLAQGLDRRRTSGGGGLTVLSCDNILTNGAVAKTSTLGAAARVSAELAGWIDEHVSFPNSMVDRITPVTTDADIAWLSEEHHIADEWPVVAEPFRQWVVEDNFGGERLPLESIDVIITDDIEPYELTKLRLLNAGHSCLAYLASLNGYERVDIAMADPTLRGFVEDFLHVEAKPTLPSASGIDLDDYISSLIERFSNPGVGDQIARLCLDGSAKFPKFLIPTIRARVASGESAARGALALAGWCEYLVRTTTPAADPLLDQAVEYAKLSVDDPAAFLGFSEVFGSDLPASPGFVEEFCRALAALRTDGVEHSITSIS